MTEGMMGRTSDTRMYNPHSESSHMYRENHEEEPSRTGYEDPRDVDAKIDRRQKKKEAEEKENRKIRHIKVRRHHMGLGEKESPDEMPEEESKFKPRESPSEPTIPAGAGGFLTSLATQAKGPGAAAGQMVQMSEPMEHAWSTLLKASIEELQQEAESLRGARDFPTARRFQSTANMLGQETSGREVAAQAAQVLSPEDEQMPGVLYEEGLQSPDFMDMRQNPEAYDPVQRENFMRLMRQMEKHRRQVAQGQENLAELRRDDPSKFFSDRMTGRVQTGEPMDYAWSELLKRETHPGESPLHFIDYENPLHQDPANQGFTDRMYLDRKPILVGPMEGGSENVHFRITNPFTRLYHPAVLDAHDDEEAFPERKIITRPDGTKEELIGLEQPIGYENILTFDGLGRKRENVVSAESLPYPTFQDIPFNEETGFTKAMDYAWSELLKESKRKTEKRRKKEQRAKWRPSTGKFKRPRGGYTGRSGTSARAKLLSRHIKGGRKSGLMLPHLAVEMSHRGVASKQPMSKDPQAYGQYRAYQEQQNILGNIRPQRGARLPSSQIRMPRVPKPRLKPHRIAPIQPPAMRRPHLVRPKMPSMVTMSEDEPISSEILKAPNRHLLIEMRNELKQLKEMMKRRDRDSKKKGMGEPDTAGAASTMPKYPGNNPKQTTRPEGATEDETDPRTFGLDPIGYLVGRGGNRA